MCAGSRWKYLPDVDTVICQLVLGFAHVRTVICQLVLGFA